MVNDREPLVPVEMQARRHVRLSMSVTASMLRGLLARLDRMGYSYRMEDGT